MEPTGTDHEHMSRLPDAAPAHRLRTGIEQRMYAAHARYNLVRKKQQVTMISVSARVYTLTVGGFGLINPCAAGFSSCSCQHLMS